MRYLPEQHNKIIANRSLGAALLAAAPCIAVSDLSICIRRPAHLGSDVVQLPYAIPSSHDQSRPAINQPSHRQTGHQSRVAKQVRDTHTKRRFSSPTNAKRTAQHSSAYLLLLLPLLLVAIKLTPILTRLCLPSTRYHAFFIHMACQYI